MNELIEKLLSRYSDSSDMEINPISFKQAIQAACQAQRNACKRVYLDMEYYGCDMDEPHGYSEDLENAEITEADYE
jgi:hypothetical protein